MKIAIFHDYFGAIGGGERVVLMMAKFLNADIITTDTDALRKMDPEVRVISLGPTPKYRGFKQIAAFLKFYLCDFSRDYDFFIFSGNWAHYAAHIAIIRISGTAIRRSGHFTISIICSSAVWIFWNGRSSGSGPGSRGDSTSDR